MAKQQKQHRFSPKFHIKRGDTVMVMTGDDKGKTGQVLQVISEKQRAIVEGVNIVKKHVKASQTEEGGITEMPAPVHISNLAIVDPKSGEPTRVGRKSVDGKNVRYSKKTGNIIE
ncbi:MAG: 50S ribosomal protein L24 [Saprospiraceae bacterium]|nr:50S ribosomal protein L24 [Saprospiraceae bacterium]